ncbi:MAG: ATP-binding protein [Endomicrobium sp.]|uniref:ATP-binding protein n=1 Tax=Candidatus Endomicrobiellum cubanum TaxID=3242325 RepID=UPI002824365C|nr:ATP-binding protein [Endomicrobium sp.]
MRKGYIYRHLQNVLKDKKFAKGVIAVTGARQTGKSTMLENLVPNIPNLTLDDLRLRFLAKKDPALFIADNKAPIFIDEVQRAPEILSYIKIEVDKAKEKNMYYLTGSQKFNMMKDMAESLAGRVSIFELLGLSMRELQNDNFKEPFLPTSSYKARRRETATPICDIWDLIHKGSMPQMYTEELDWKKFYADYMNTYLERDVSQLAQVGNSLKFIKFMEVLAARISNMLNLNDVCRDVGISHPTAEHWLSILQSSNIIYLLRPYYNNRTNRAIKTPKLYFLDTGLVAYLTHWDTKDVLKSGAKKGDFLENFVICEILKSYYNAGLEPNNLYYYRDKNQREIDLIIEIGGVLYPTEIKSKSNPTKQDIPAFEFLSAIAKIDQGAVICLCDKPFAIYSGVYALPVWYI